MKDEDTININIGKNAPAALKELILSALPEAIEINVVDHSKPDEPQKLIRKVFDLDPKSSRGREVCDRLLKGYSTATPTAFVGFDDDYFSIDDYGWEEGGRYWRPMLGLSHRKHMEVRIRADISRRGAIQMLKEVIADVTCMSDDKYSEYGITACEALGTIKENSEELHFWEKDNEIR